MNGTENPASTNRLMEEVCERENLREGLRRVKANQGSAGVDGDDRRRHQRLLETAVTSHPGTTTERDLRTETGEAGGNPQAGRIFASERGVRKLGIPTVLDRFIQQAG
jgi:RNA-directed DNA polymerase